MIELDISHEELRALMADTIGTGLRTVNFWRKVVGMQAVDFHIPKCPRCEEPVVRVIEYPGKPTMFIHARNNQSDLVHTDEQTAVLVHLDDGGVQLCDPSKLARITSEGTPVVLCDICRKKALNA